MPWDKNRPYSPGEMEFHLTGLRQMEGELPQQNLNMERIQRRLARHHAQGNVQPNEANVQQNEANVQQEERNREPAE